MEHVVKHRPTFWFEYLMWHMDLTVEMVEQRKSMHIRVVWCS